MKLQFAGCLVLRSQMLRRRCIWQHGLCMSGYPCMPKSHLYAHTVRRLRHRVGQHGAVDVKMAPTSTHVHLTNDRSCQNFGARDTHGTYLMPTTYLGSRHCLVSEEREKSKGIKK